MRHLFRWSGELAGFIDEAGELCDMQGECQGHLERDGTAWDNENHFLGELVDGHYILRNVLKLPPSLRVRHTPTHKPSDIPPLVASRMPRAPIPGWIDALDEYGLMPKKAWVRTSATRKEDQHAFARAGKDEKPESKT